MFYLLNKRTFILHIKIRNKIPILINYFMVWILISMYQCFHVWKEKPHIFPHSAVVMLFNPDCEILFCYQLKPGGPIIFDLFFSGWSLVIPSWVSVSVSGTRSPCVRTEKSVTVSPYSSTRREITPTRPLESSARSLDWETKLADRR